MLGDETFARRLPKLELTVAGLHNASACVVGLREIVLADFLGAQDFGERGCRGGAVTHRQDHPVNAIEHAGLPLTGRRPTTCRCG